MYLTERTFKLSYSLTERQRNIREINGKIDRLELIRRQWPGTLRDSPSEKTIVPVSYLKIVKFTTE